MDAYDPIKVLGEGSFGKVYLMKHKETRELVCTKVIKLKNIPKKEQEACRNEVELLRRMVHPNIVGYTDSFLYKNCLCIIMEYCDAGDLGDRVNKAKGRLLPETKIMMWFVQVALGLHYMHSHRILHRDIKTQNIFILSSGRVVLGDLGISKVMEGTRDFASTCIGTPYYMSPEIFQNRPYNHKSDVWALGCVLYELTTLKHAFDAQSLNGLAGKIIKGRYPPVAGDYSKHLRSLVKDMLATNPKSRPDIEQVLRKSFVKKCVREFVQDLNADALHRSDKAMRSLQDQLNDLEMGDFLIATGEGYTSSEASTPPPAAAPPSPAAPAAAAAAATAGNGAGGLRQQKHELEVQEERRIAAEMALNRLRKKAEERRRRASLSAPSSPSGADGGDAGAEDEAGGTGSNQPRRERRPSLIQRLSGAGSRPSSMSPRDGNDNTGGSVSSAGGATGDGPTTPTRERRPSILQQLADIAPSLPGLRKSQSPSPTTSPRPEDGSSSSKPASPSGAAVRARRGSRITPADIDAMGSGDIGNSPARGPTGARRPSLGRPEGAAAYVSNPAGQRAGRRPSVDDPTAAAALTGSAGSGGDGRGRRASRSQSNVAEPTEASTSSASPSRDTKREPPRRSVSETPSGSAAAAPRRSVSRSPPAEARELPPVGGGGGGGGSPRSGSPSRGSKEGEALMPSSSVREARKSAADESNGQPRKLSVGRRGSPDLPQLSTSAAAAVAATPSLRTGREGSMSPRAPSPRDSPRGSRRHPPRGEGEPKPPLPPPPKQHRSSRSDGPGVIDTSAAGRGAVSDAFEDSDEERDFFALLKAQAQAHAQEGEDEDVHHREEELEAKLREAEMRCKELQETLERARAAGRRGSGIPAEAVGMAVNPRVSNDGGGGKFGLQLDDRAEIMSDAEDEPSPYCQSHLSAIEDPPTPVGKLVDRVQFLRRKCIEGLGEEVFSRAFKLLADIMDEGGKVEVDGVMYNGANDDEVQAMLEKVMGRHNLKYWNLMDQLLLMQA